VIHGLYQALWFHAISHTRKRNSYAVASLAPTRLYVSEKLDHDTFTSATAAQDDHVENDGESVAVLIWSLYLSRFEPQVSAPANDIV